MAERHPARRAVHRAITANEMVTTRWSLGSILPQLRRHLTNVLEDCAKVCRSNVRHRHLLGNCRIHRLRVKARTARFRQVARYSFAERQRPTPGKVSTGARLHPAGGKTQVISAFFRHDSSHALTRGRFLKHALEKSHRLVAKRSLLLH